MKKASDYRRIAVKNIWQKLPPIVRGIVIIALCWVLFVSVEGFHLIGSTDPGKFPFLRLGGVQTQDIVARYDSLGFSQIYYLTDGDTFISGEFKVLGFSVKKWENPDFADAEDEEDDALDELAQTLYDLRVETIADPDDPGALTAIRAMLDAMGASELGPYALEYHDITHGLPVTENGMLAEEDGWPKGDGDAPPYRKTALVVRYTEPFAADDKRVNKVHGVMSELLMVLVEDLDRVSFEFTRVNKPGGEFGYGTTREIVDEMAKYLGRDHPAELAASPEGIRTILRYCGDRVYEFLPVLDEEEGEYTYQWLDKETATNVGYLHMDFKITAVFPDCFFAKPEKPISGEFKFNGVLPDEWNVGDQVLCVSQNAYFDEQSNRWESDIIRVEESNWN